MPIRILLRLFFLAGLAAPWCAFALGVGQLEVRSALNQTFEAELPLITDNPIELTGLTARIPRQEEFNRAGIERLEFLSKLRFSVQAPPGGPKVVKITSLEPIREPNFTLLLELVWQRGRLIREFAVQLDPELYANRRQPPAPPPVVAPLPPVAAPAPVAPPAVPPLPPAPPVSFEGASFYGPVRSGETLAAIANRVRPSTAISVPQMMSILIAGNPTAFANGNPNTLRSGATLKVPTAQALGAPSAPSPPTPAPVPAPTPAGPAIASTPTDLTTSGPAAASAPRPVSPAEPVVPGTPPSPVIAPPPVVTTPLPPPPLAEVAPPPTMPLPVAGPGGSAPPSPPSPSSTEPLREIVPRSTVPQPEAPPVAAPQPPAPPVAAPQPPAPPVAAPQPPAPPVAAPQPPAPKPKPPAPPPVEAESSWMSNPVVWIAILLIALAIAALIVLPLLRRPARPKPSVEEELAVLESTETLPTVIQSREGTTARTRPREPVSVRPRPAAKLAAVPPAAPSQERAAPSPVSPPTPKPIGELLKDFDFNLGEGGASPAARPGGTPARDIKAPLLEAEPPTASVTRHPVSPLAEQENQREAPVQPQMELPSELRLDGLDFELDGFGLGKAARSQPSELPPLEMKPGGTGARKPSEPSPLERDITEPPTESSSLAPKATAPADSPKPGLKFEFADVTQDLAKSRAAEEPLKLDEALQGLGGDTLKLGDKKEEAIGGVAGGISAADYVETKLDLASAYLEMGDQVGARSLLDEVLREGNATQKERARGFLKQLS